MLKIFKKRLNNNLNLIILYFIGLVLAVSAALPAYVQSNFLNQFVDLNTLSLFFIIANTFTVLSIIFFPKLIKKLSNFSLTKLIMALHALSLIGLAFTGSATTALISIILFTVSTNLLWINMDVLIEAFSKDSSTGKTRTIYFTFINIGWIISPSISSYLVKIGDYKLTFLIAAFLILPVLFLFNYQRKNLKDKISYSKEKMSEVIKKTWKNKNLRGIFFVALLLQVFFNTAVVYLPIYLHQNLGISWAELGLMFSIMLIPFLVFEIPAGIIADKYLGEKEILFLGFTILVISIFLFFYLESVNFWIWASVLFFSRVGAALIEAMRETYFFKIVNAKDLGYINIFRVANPLGYIIGSSFAMATLVFLPLNYLFLIISLIMLSGIYFVASIKDTK